MTKKTLLDDFLDGILIGMGIVTLFTLGLGFILVCTYFLTR